jgi:hypothetical protein
LEKPFLKTEITPKKGTHPMSTSRYSKPDITSPSNTDDYPEPHMKLHFPEDKVFTAKWTPVRLVSIAALLFIDILAIIGSYDIVDTIALVLLVLVNLWALNYAR